MGGESHGGVKMVRKYGTRRYRGNIGVDVNVDVGVRNY
jgi:hypothetical protein